MAFCVGQKLAYHDDAIVHPQKDFPFAARPTMLGLDADGETIRTFNLAEECREMYFVLCFFTMDFKADNSEVLKLNAAMKDFEENNTRVYGVTQDSPYVSRHWTRKPLSRGGFGSKLNFPMLTDKDLYLSNLMGVSRPSGLPCRSTFIIDWQGRVRYMMCHKSEMGRSVKDILRIARAFRYSDLTGKITPAGWQPGDPVIPTDFTAKSRYYKEKYSGWTSDDEESSKASSQESKSRKSDSDSDRKSESSRGFISQVIDNYDKKKSEASTSSSKQS